MRNFTVHVVSLSLLLALSSPVWAQSAADSQGKNVPSPIGENSMMAASPFTDYTAGVVAYVLAVGFLVALLLIGGILIVNLGFLSKREEDRIGGRTPSDLGILKGTFWPNEPDQTPVLPAEEEETGLTAVGLKERRERPEKREHRFNFRKPAA